MSGGEATRRAHQDEILDGLGADTAWRRLSIEDGVILNAGPLPEAGVNWRTASITRRPGPRYAWRAVVNYAERTGVGGTPTEAAAAARAALDNLTDYVRDLGTMPPAADVKVDQLARLAAAAERIADALAALTEHAPGVLAALEAINETTLPLGDLADAVDRGQVHVTVQPVLIDGELCQEARLHVDTPPTPFVNPAGGPL